LNAAFGIVCHAIFDAIAGKNFIAGIPVKIVPPRGSESAAAWG
jgi:hypothetical protein